MLALQLPEPLGVSGSNLDLLFRPCAAMASVTLRPLNEICNEANDRIWDEIERVVRKSMARDGYTMVP